MYDVTSGNIFPLRNNIAACYSQRGSGHGDEVKTSESTCHEQALKCVLVGVFCCTGRRNYCRGLLSPRHNTAHHPHQTDVCYRRDRTVISIYFHRRRQQTPLTVFASAASDKPTPPPPHPSPLPPPNPLRHKSNQRTKCRERLGLTSRENWKVRQGKPKNKTKKTTNHVFIQFAGVSDQRR